MKRTNIVLDDNLVKDCMKATGIKTQKALIDHALRELLRHLNSKVILPGREILMSGVADVNYDGIS